MAGFDISTLPTIENEARSVSVEADMLLMHTKLSHDSPYCDILDDPTHQERTFDESEHFFALISLGPLTLGHTLLCPKSPARAIAEAIDVPGRTEEFVELLERTTKRLCSVFHRQSTVLFEHGNASIYGTSLCSTDHAHLHIVPCDSAPTAAVAHTYFDWTSIPSVADLVLLSRRRQEYLFYSDGRANIVNVVRSEKPVPSQFFRKIVGGELGMSEWNWKTDPRRKVVSESLDALRACGNVTARRTSRARSKAGASRT